MAEITIIHRIEAPEITAALEKLMEGLWGKTAIRNATPGAGSFADKPAAAPATPQINPAPIPPVAPIVSDVPVTAPPIPVPPVVTFTAPVAPPPIPQPPQARAYTFEDLVKAGGQFMDAGPAKQRELAAALQEFGVTSLVELSPNFYPQLAEKLRALGANI